MLSSHIHEVSSVAFVSPMSLVNMSKNVQFWFYFLYCLCQSLRTSMFFLPRSVECAVRRTMRNKNINVLRQIAPNITIILFVILKSSSGIFDSIWRSKNLKSLNFNQLMLEIMSPFFDLIDYFLSVKLNRWSVTSQGYFSSSFCFLYSFIILSSEMSWLPAITIL